jgi:radical SAM protein with 4Fe4S-binding SPASM domain
MRAWNRFKLLWGYLRGKSRLSGLPVEYIVETTTKCNLYCPMCARESLPQPKEDMPETVFRRLVQDSGDSAEHMMLIGLGEPLLDPLIYGRVALCARHGISTLLSTNGVLLDEEASARLLDSPIEQVTLSFDGATKETFEFYRKGARFESVRDNFVRFCRMKQERRPGLQVVVQMVRMERNASEVDAFISFWSAVPGVDQVRIKEDETNLMRPYAGHAATDWKHPCHYLWRGPMYIKQNGDVYPCCQSCMLGGRPVGRIGEAPLEGIWNSRPMQEMRRLHAAGRASSIDVCSRCCTTIPHPALVAGSLILHGRTVRRMLPLVERLAYFSRWGRRLLRPPR